MKRITILTLTGSVFRRLARADFSGIASATHREIRVPTSTVARPLHTVYRAIRNYLGRVAYSGTARASSEQALYLFYDLEVAPITFDFGWTLALADMKRRKLGLRTLRVVIVPGPHAGGRQESRDYDAIFDRESRQWRLWSIVVEMCRSLSSDCSVLVCSTRAEAEEIFFSNAVHIFPEKYTPNSPIVVKQDLIKAHLGCRDLAVFSAPPEATRYVAKWINANCPGRKLVVITLRQSEYMPDRNSELSSWKSFAAGLDAETYHVALIPDTDTAAQWSDRWPNTTVVTEACFNLQIRHAFYECCYAGLSVSSGPLILAQLNPRAAFAMFIKVRESVPQATRAVLASFGFKFGQTPIFFTSSQRWVWEDDCLENIQQSFRQLEEVIEHSQLKGHASRMLRGK